jgi:hypothetical protein
LSRFGQRFALYVDVFETSVSLDLSSIVSPDRNFNVFNEVSRIFEPVYIAMGGLILNALGMVLSAML